RDARLHAARLPGSIRPLMKSRRVRKAVLQLGVWLALLSTGKYVEAAPSPDRPNLVFILMDDLGWADLGCYGSTFYRTPNLDRMAAGGLRFINGYAACPVCSPTRSEERRV